MGHARAISRHSSDRRPSLPAPALVDEIPWHGNPSDSRSAKPDHSLPSELRTSDKIRKARRALSFCHCARTGAARASPSAAHTFCHLMRWPPRTSARSCEKEPAHSIGLLAYARRRIPREPFTADRFGPESASL